MPYVRFAGSPFLRAFFLAVTLSASPAAHAQGGVAGVVVDSEGGALSRAHVRLVAADDTVVAQGFTDPVGRFQFGANCNSCRVEASLAGFKPASADAGTVPLRIVLTVGPIEEAVVVSATRGEAPVSQVGSTIAVFSAAEIERRGTPLVGDLLRASPGATVVRAGGHGNVTSLFVRGGESNYNKVLLDGIPLNEPGGTFNFGNLTTEHLERVEVLRGAHSALFGTDAMASVVNLVTRRAARPSASVSFELGSYDWRRGSVTGGIARDGVDVSGHVSRLYTSNRVPNNTFDNTTISINGGVRLARDFAFRFVGRGEIGHVGVPGATAFGRPDTDASFDRRDAVGGATLLHHAPAWEQRVTYALTSSRQESRNEIADPSYTPSFGDRRAPFAFSDFPYDSETRLRRHHAAYQADWRVASSMAGTHLLTALFEWDGERGRLTNRLAGSTVRASRDNLAAAIQHQMLGARYALTAGVRLEGNDSFGTAMAPRASLVYLARESSGTIGATRLKTSAGTGVKEPTILQSFSPSPSFLGNPDLDPERSRAFDGGIDQRLFGDRVKVEVSGFYGRFENIISTRTTSFNPFRAQYFNVGLTHARGAELTIQAAPASAVSLSASYTFLDSEVTRSTAPTNPVFAEGRPLFRRPRHSGFFGVAWSHGAGTVDVHGTFVGERVDSDFVALVPPLVSSPAYATWDVGMSYRAWRRMTWFARVHNIADVDYMEPLGYPSWRRTARIGIRVAF